MRIRWLGALVALCLVACARAVEDGAIGGEPGFDGLAEASATPEATGSVRAAAPRIEGPTVREVVGVSAQEPSGDARILVAQVREAEAALDEAKRNRESSQGSRDREQGEVERLEQEQARRQAEVERLAVRLAQVPIELVEARSEGGDARRVMDSWRRDYERGRALSERAQEVAEQAEGRYREAQHRREYAESVMNKLPQGGEAWATQRAEVDRLLAEETTLVRARNDARLESEAASRTWNRARQEYEGAESRSRAADARMTQLASELGSTSVQLASEQAALGRIPADLARARREVEQADGNLRAATDAERAADARRRAVEASLEGARRALLTRAQELVRAAPALCGLFGDLVDLGLDRTGSGALIGTLTVRTWGEAPRAVPLASLSEGLRNGFAAEAGRLEAERSKAVARAAATEGARRAVAQRIEAAAAKEAADRTSRDVLAGLWSRIQQITLLKDKNARKQAWAGLATDPEVIRLLRKVDKGKLDDGAASKVIERGLKPEVEALDQQLRAAASTLQQAKAEDQRLAGEQTQAEAGARATQADLQAFETFRAKVAAADREAALEGLARLAALS